MAALFFACVFFPFSSNVALLKGSTITTNDLLASLKCKCELISSPLVKMDVTSKDKVEPTYTKPTAWENSAVSGTLQLSGMMNRRKPEVLL
eukprot:m.107538 g.107538  ORF g.107538 m.107538 type:complete len:91 (+) comp37303_c0_seq6:4223-4495(+)